MALLSRQLSTIARDVPLNADRKAVERRSPDLHQLNEIYDDARFGQALRRQAERIAAHF